jgi:hypothetical protein
MASLTTKLSELTRSPKGRQLAEKAKEYVNKPENRRKVEELRVKLARKR